MKNQKKASFQSKFWKPIPNDEIVLNKAIFTNSGFDKHIHEEYAIGIISQGVMDGFVDGSSKKISRSFIQTINPDTAHSNRALNNETYSQYSMYLKPSFLNSIFKENFNSNPRYFKAGLFEDKHLANRLFYLISQQDKKFLTTIDYESELIGILHEILLKNTTVQQQRKLSKHDLAIYRAKEFIQDNLSSDLTLEDIAKQIDISKFHFHRLFKEHTHFSPHAYLMQKRIDKARKLLQKGCALANVAYECGFNDQSHLTKRFKAFVGLTPKEYQKFFI